MYPNSSVSIVIEVLQRVEPPHSSDAVKFGLPAILFVFLPLNNVPSFPDFTSSH